MGIYDVDFFWGEGDREELHKSVRDIGSHQNFQKPEFFMPELFLKELCCCASIYGLLILVQ